MHFGKGLRELGYVEGKNIVIEYRYAEGKEDLIPELVAELIHLKVDVIVVSASADDDPCGEKGDQDDSHRHDRLLPIRSRAGLIDSLARPGGNITGLTRLHPRTKRKAAGATKGSGARIIPRRGPFRIRAQPANQRV